MTVTDALDLWTTKLGAVINLRYALIVRGGVPPRVAYLIGKGPVQTLSHSHVLWCVMKDVLLLQQQLIDSSPVNSTR